EAEVGANEPRRLGQARLRGVRQKADDQLDGAQSGELAGFHERALREHDAVVDEVPVGAADEPDVRLEDDDATARFEKRPRNPELLDDGFAVRQMLEVVRHERDVEMVVRQVAIELETVGLDEPHLLRQMRRDVSQVGGPLLRGRYVAYEVATVARDIEHGAVFWDVALEECGDLAPDRILRGGVCI